MSYLYETHMHTAEASACGVATGAEQARAYAALGYAGIIVTDHFFEGNTAVPRNLPWRERIDIFVTGYQNAKKAGEPLGLDVFLGWEYKAEHWEFLTYGLDYDFLVSHPELEHMSVKDYSGLVRKNGGYLAQAHPFREAPYIKISGAVDAKLIDGVESYNAHNERGYYNTKAAEFARKYDLPVQSGTDSHWTEQEFVSGIALKKRAENIFDIINAIKNREARLIKPGRNRREE